MCGDLNFLSEILAILEEKKRANNGGKAFVAVFFSAAEATTAPSHCNRGRRDGGVVLEKGGRRELETPSIAAFRCRPAFGESDFSSAQILGLRLLGFLDSRSVTDADRAFIGPIRQKVASKVDLALEGLVSDTNRQAFEIAKTAQGPIFASKGGFDVEKIKQSKHFRFHLSQSNGRGATEMEERLDTDKLIPKAPKSMMQAKLTSFHGNNMAKLDNQRQTSMNNHDRASDECVIVERSHGFGFGTKKTHVQSSSLANDEETKAEGATNGFMSAKTKLSEKNALGRGYSSRSGGLRRGLRGNFVPPVKSNGNNVGNMTSRIGGKTDDALDDSTRTCLEMLCGPDGELPEKLRNLEPRLIEHDFKDALQEVRPSVSQNELRNLRQLEQSVWWFKPVRVRLETSVLETPGPFINLTCTKNRQWMRQLTSLSISV